MVPPAPVIMGNVLYSALRASSLPLAHASSLTFDCYSQQSCEESINCPLPDWGLRFKEVGFSRAGRACSGVGWILLPGLSPLFCPLVPLYFQAHPLPVISPFLPILIAPPCPVLLVRETTGLNLRKMSQEGPLELEPCLEWWPRGHCSPRMGF